jgi:carboxymethylenebutenolidase
MNQPDTPLIRQALPGAYLAEPISPNGRGVLVLHAWWGLNAFIQDFCDRLAQAGFMALAPDLYHGTVAVTIEQAKKLRSKVKKEATSQEITSAADHLCQASGAAIGVIGFSLGGYWALWLADQPNSPVAAAVVFYASRHGNYAASQAAFQFHLAETDDYVAASGVKKMQKSLQAAGKTTEFYTYPGTTHWFFEADRPRAYQPAAAGLAWERTVAFLTEHLRAS